jgi:hypothetical protein
MLNCGVTNRTRYAWCRFGSDTPVLTFSSEAFPPFLLFSRLLSGCTANFGDRIPSEKQDSSIEAGRVELLGNVSCSGGHNYSEWSASSLSAMIADL